MFRKSRFVMAFAICSATLSGTLAQRSISVSRAKVSQPISSLHVSPPQQLASTTPNPVTELIPALTPVEIEIEMDLGSKISKPGDKFPLRLHQAIIRDGKELVPAGTAGIGEVVEAKPAGKSGVPGILILAARYLNVSGHLLPLRSMRLAKTGNNKIRVANNVGLATAMIFPVVSTVGLFLSGNEMQVPHGSIAGAKTAIDFALAAIDGNKSTADSYKAVKEKSK